MNSDDSYPATENPEVVRSVVKLIKGGGAREVVVGDISGLFWLPTKKCKDKTGIGKAAEEAGARGLLTEKSFQNLMKGIYTGC